MSAGDEREACLQRQLDAVVVRQIEALPQYYHELSGERMGTAYGPYVRREDVLTILRSPERETK